MSRLTTAAPSLLLRNFVSHYWLSLDNTDLTHAALPDGAVDLVVSTHGSSTRSWVYGTTTTRTDIGLEPNNHYLGVRFKPGQSRHFINAATYELTDRCEPAGGLIHFSLDQLSENIANQDVFTLLNNALETYLAKRQPVRTKIDDVINLIESMHGNIRIDDAASVFDRSRRQLERVFLETVGVSAKLFSSITRFHHAAALIAQRSSTLVDVAAEAGYTDQSHMTHDFQRMARVSPAMYARRHVVFLQDPPLLTLENEHS
jgi:AraC-like DNA-binding protein